MMIKLNVRAIAVAGLLSLVGICLVPTLAQAANVTGDPAADGWALHGNALDNGLYAAGSANYNYELYSANFTVESSSNLEISDDDYSWLAGDTILGAGGKFTSITASEAGWASFSGNAVNSLLTTQDYGPKLQVKMGTANATWSTSTAAPASGDGYTSTGGGGEGTVHFRTSGWFHKDTPLGAQVTDTTWSDHSGLVMLLDKDSHIRRRDEGTTATDGSYHHPDTRVARVIWEYDESLGAGKPVSWQLLLNTSLLDRTAPDGFTGLTPTGGDLFVWSVQDRDSAYTDAVGASVPEPATMGLLALGGVALLRRRRAA